MNTIKELTDYCKIDNPIGALLLTGEWGCGKTYIIENQLKKELMYTHIIIRVSLFGIPSVEEFHKSVKRAYIHGIGGAVDKVSEVGKIKGAIDKVKDLIPNTTVKHAVSTVLSVNLVDFVKVENRVQSKKVVLVFDDLERSKLTTEEKLGSINEYCENQHFNVIIVADEDKLKNDSYKEFKEKVVQRTIHHSPYYVDLIRSIIGEISDPGYNGFLRKNEPEITALFAGTDMEGQSLDQKSKEKIDSTYSTYDKDREQEKSRWRDLLKKRPHNIRSLKAAIQDFYRIYDLLEEKCMADTHKWLFSFLSFNLAAKANLIEKNERYGILFSSQDTSILYPGFFDPRYLPDLLSDWVMNGVFDEDSFKSYLDARNKANEAQSPKERVKKNRIDYLDESEVVQGMKEILPDVYKGDLELNEYVYFIINSKLYREYGFDELTIEWDKVNDGIRNRIEKRIQKGEKRESHTVSISDFDSYTEEENKAYNIIKTARESSYAMYETNRREFIQAFKDCPYDAFIKISGKRYNCFDAEMADATLDAFKFVDNPTKAQYPDYFKGLWSNYRYSNDMEKEGIEKTEEGFMILKNGLLQLLDEYADLPFKKRYTKAFIDVIDRLMEDEELDVITDGVQ